MSCRVGWVREMCANAVVGPSSRCGVCEGKWGTDGSTQSRYIFRDGTTFTAHVTYGCLMRDPSCDRNWTLAIPSVALLLFDAFGPPLSACQPTTCTLHFSADNEVASFLSSAFHPPAQLDGFGTFADRRSRATAPWSMCWFLGPVWDPLFDLHPRMEVAF
jgi:hypothetical protein